MPWGTCACCGEPFAFVGIGQRFCSGGRCAAKALRRRAQIRRRDRRRALRVPRPCRLCGRPVEPGRRGPIGEFCGSTCRWEFYGHRRVERIHDGRPLESVQLLAVFERDGGRCHLCGEPVDRAVRAPDPMCASVDHLLAVSRGGAHVLANVALAHLGCNMRRGVRGFGVRLSAQEAEL